MEREGYDVAYCTDIDVHENATLLLNYGAFLSVGHDEYWTWEMRSNVTAARDLGVNLGFFGANACYWQIRLEPSAIDGGADRVQVGYKETAANDPYALDADPTNDQYITNQWRQNGFTLPEEALIGVQYVTDPVNGEKQDFYQILTHYFLVFRQIRAGEMAGEWQGILRGPVFPL